MNFLAHLYLSGEDEELLIGNFLADFISNRQLKTFSEGVQRGIFLHRKIDSFTDNHPVVRQGTKRLRASHRKYSPVILDVLFDYLLANNWEKYSNESLKNFTKKVYEILVKKINIMPTRIQKNLPIMVADDWLVKYGFEDGLRYTFERMKKRVSQPDLLENAVESMRKDYDLFEKEFNEFFPEVINYVARVSLMA